MTKPKKPALVIEMREPYSLVLHPVTKAPEIADAVFVQALDDARKALRDAGGNPDDLGGAAWCWNQAVQKNRNRIKAAGSALGGAKTKAKAAPAHEEIAAKLAEGQPIKAVQLEREEAGKPSSSASTVRRVKKAKNL